jgi:hypothetical protein
VVDIFLTGPANLSYQLFQLYIFEKIKIKIGNITKTGTIISLTLIEAGSGY